MVATRSTPKPGATLDGSSGPTVVGIGASAGGLKALQQFVEAVPRDSGLAYVVIVHLDPSRQSRMRELLQDRSAIPVTQVDGPTEAAADHIYIIPPNQDLAMRAGMLELRERGERSDHAPIDLFFRTLAEARGADSLGVVLSGTGADGTAGIRYIREAGGMTVAQSPDESEYDGMPASAIATGLVDLVLPSSRIPRELLRLRRLAERVEDGAPATAESEQELGRILGTLRARTGHDFSLYKRSTVMRRLERRLRFNEVSTLEAYQRLLQSSVGECQALLRDLLISVSSFFRDPEAFEALTEQVPALFEGKGAADAVRAWVVGCATGEEAYSVAMVLAEHAATLADPPRLQLFATDIDEHGYAWARAGFYTAAAVSGVPPERLRRFFTRESGGYRIVKSLRELVLFAGHDVLRDPPFSRMDLLSCRNLFIYLQPAAQERALETFHFALNPGGLLFLGAAESVGENGLFSATATTQRLFRSNAVSQRVLPRQSAADPQPGAGAQAKVGNSGAAAAARPAFSYGVQHAHLLEMYAPASAIVNERLEVVHLSTAAGRFLQLNEGAPSHNLLMLAMPALRRVLRTALHHVFSSGVPMTRRISTVLDGRQQQISLHLQPSTEDGTAARHALIVFESEDEVEGGPDGAGLPSAEIELEAELRRTRDLLESTTAAHDWTVAELQMTNEELQSINEEQQAATEELETGREEIQSINEELTTINQEHQSTIEELKRTNADLQNLIESTGIGTIFLDRAMRVRRFTPAVEDLFNFIATDQGRPFAHITHRLRYGALLKDVASVLDSLERIESEVETDTGESYIVRISPYRSHDGGHEGAVLTFIDNTAQHRVAQELREAKVVAESANMTKVTFLSTLSHEFRTPLNAILGYADLLSLDGALNEAQESKVERIRVGGWHLADMIEEILSFAKLDGGHERVESEPVDARRIASGAAALVEAAAARKGLAFLLDMPPDEVPMVTDAGKARQILVNLCSNAVKYTAQGEVRLRVLAAPERVLFEVSDSGIGVASEHHGRIFDRFWQVDGGSTRAAGGLGIGLAAARDYARLLGGDVVVESELGKGSTFRLWLPLA